MDHHLHIFLFSVSVVLMCVDCDVMPVTASSVLAPMCLLTSVSLLYFQTPQAFQSVHTCLAVLESDTG